MQKIWLVYEVQILSGRPYSSAAVKSSCRLPRYVSEINYLEILCGYVPCCRVSVHYIAQTQRTDGRGSVYVPITSTPAQRVSQTMLLVHRHRSIYTAIFATSAACLLLLLSFCAHRIRTVHE